MIDRHRILHILLKLMSYLRKEKWQIEPNGMAKARSLSFARMRGHVHADDMGASRTEPRSPVFYEPVPADSLANPCRSYSLINSVAFHPDEPLFCATFTTAHKLGLFRVDTDGKMTTVQVIGNPGARLRGPQHAAFARDGQAIIVANWNDATLAIYRREDSGMYAQAPVACMPFPEAISDHKPHGLEVSPSGKRVALALGASAKRKKGVALFDFDSRTGSLVLLSLIAGDDLPGIPKGVTFSPDESHLIVSFSDVNSIQVYELAAGRKIVLPARQVLKGECTGLFRPEDVKVSREGDLLIVSNSEANKVSFYPFDRLSNRITQDSPCRTFQHADSNLSFPHGIAVSPDGSVLVISQFGPLQTTRDEDIDFGISTPRRQSRISTFRRERPPSRESPRSSRTSASPVRCELAG